MEWWVVCFLTAVGAAGFPCLAQDPPVEGRFRELTGEVRIETTNAEILGWLAAPGNRGMSQLSVRAVGLGADAGLMAQAVAPTPGRLANPYRLSVQAGTNEATAIAYELRGIVGLDADRQLYQTRAVLTGPLEAGPDAVVRDLAECGAAVRFRFVDDAGQPVAVPGGQGLVIADGELRVQVFGLVAGATEAFVLVPSDADLDLSFEFQRGSDPYLDRMNRPVAVSARVPCGSVEVVDVVFGSTALLGRISGVVDLVGEFEKTTGPAVSGGITGRTVMVAQGPAANRRLGGLTGDNVAVPASGTVALENLLPSDAVTPSEPWRLQAQMHLRGGRAFEYFLSPAVGEGLNPGLRVTGGETTPLGEIFQLRAGWIAGRVELVGPPETAATKSALRGVQRPDDAGVDAFGIPAGAAAYGITDSHVVATGVDARAAGANWTAAGGRAAVNFSGDFDAGRSRFAGTYEIAVGGLEGEASVWKRDQFQLSLFTSGEGHPGVNQVLNIEERAAPPLTVVPGERVAADVRLGFGEVCVRLRTPGRRFHSPAVSQARGEFVGVDFEGRMRDYLVTIEAAYGAPLSAEEAAETGLLTLALPEGTYRMRPSLRVLNEDGTESLTELDEIEVVVVARQRVCVEGCLRVRAQVEGCGTNGMTRLTGRVDSCGQSVASVTYQIDEGPHVVVCRDCGTTPALDFEVPVQAGNHTVTVTATDVAGSVASVTADATRVPPPVLVAVAPDRVSPSGGTPIVITGEWLDAGDEIRVGGLPLETPVWVSTTEISGVVPALAVGPHAVEAWRCGTLVATLPVQVVAGERPVLSEVSPNVSHPPGGGTLVAVGSGFGPATRLRIAFDASDASLVRDLVVMPGGGLLMGTIPPLPEGVALGTYDVVAEDPNGNAVLVGAFTYHPTPLPTEDPLWAALTALESESATPMQVSLRSGQVEAIGGRFPVSGSTPEARAVSFLESHRALLQLPPAGPLELGVDLAVSEEMDHVRLVQSIGGVPVYAGEVVVSLHGSEVFAVNGALVSPEVFARAGVSLTPTLSAMDARMVALRAIGIPAPGFGIPAENTVVVFDPAVLGDQPSEPHLAQHIRFPALDREVFVDAHTGSVLLTRALSQTSGGPLDGLNLEVRDARGMTNLVDGACQALSTTALVARGLVDGDDDDSFIQPGYAQDALATAVYRFARDAYGFFNGRFAWQGFGNSDWPVLVFAHDTVPNNAFAHGCFIRIGDQLVDYEVVVHEYAHNVISARRNSRLQYMNQSGALNESYADTMGVAAGRLAGQTEWRFGPGIFSREFIDPTQSGLGNSPQPAHFSAFVTFLPDTNGVVADNGGVHMNSGIPNRAAYLLSEGMVLPNGGATPRFHPGVGLDRMLALKFASMRFLPANASFAVARSFEVQYATTLALLPLSGWSAQDVAAVRNSWFLVGVGNPDLNGDGIEETSDVDRDFVPDALDNCRLVPNPRQEDADADGIGDVCDNCPKIANNRQSNLDGDPFGDECDDDMDGDGCRNDVDQEPRESIGVIGRTVSLASSAHCEAQEGDFYGPVSLDTDRDGRRDCEDDDDDGDGIPDAADPCPVGPLADFFGKNFLPLPYMPLVGECGVQALCIPRLPPAVLDYGAFDFEGVFIRVRDSRINPNPERDAILDDVRIVNGTLYANPGPGVSLGALAARVVGRSGSGGRRDAGVAGPVPEDWRRMEVWQRPASGGAPVLLGILGEFDPESLTLEGLGAGHWLALTPSIGAAPARLAATWNFGGAEVSVTEDSDRDGLPDGYELAMGLDPRNPADGAADVDGDGLSALDEYRAGTNPASALSRFGMEGFERVAGGLRVTWSAAPGNRVILERAARIDATTWEPVGASVLMQGDRAERVVPVAEAGEGFFRLRRP
jgi:Zn-dependent metalloprotease